MSGSSNSSFSSNQVQQNIFQNSSAVCVQTESNDFSNNIVFLDGGSFSLNQTIQYDANCTIRNELDAQVAAALSNSATQFASTTGGLFLPSFDSASNNSTQKNALGQSISQILSSTCVQDQKNTADNDVIVSKGANVIINQDIAGKGSCDIGNIARSVATGDLSNTVKQTAEVLNAWVQIITVLAICGAVVGVATVAFRPATGAKEGTTILNADQLTSLINTRK